MREGKHRKVEVTVKVHVHFKHTEINKKIEKSAIEKAHKLDKFELKPSEIVYHFSAKQHRFECRVFVRGPQLQLQASAVEEDLQSSLEQALDRLERQMARWKSKTQNHRVHHRTKESILGRLSPGLEMRAVSKSKTRKSSRAA